MKDELVGVDQEFTELMAYIYSDLIFLLNEDKLEHQNRRTDYDFNINANHVGSLFNDRILWCNPRMHRILTQIIWHI